MLRRLSRELAFARHIPPGRALRRLELALRWGLSDIAPPSLPRQAPPLRQAPPRPVFAPRAGMIAAHRERLALSFLNRTETVGEPIDWSAPGPGVSNQLWRMHLHFMEFVEAASPQQAQAWMLDWIGANPPTTRGFWRDVWYPYTISLRAVVWMQQLARHAGAFAPDACSAITRSLAAQIAYLAEHLETDIGGNHLIKNAKALLWASAFFEGPAAERWGRRGAALLQQELPRQILADGVHYERSASYHAQVFADLLELRALPDRFGAGAAIDAVLAPMAQALADLAHPDGGPALFNDSGLAMAYAPEACLSVFRARAGAAVNPAPAFAYRNAGYFGARFPDLYFLIDCGPIAPDDLPAHGHGDLLSFELSLLGQRVIVDQGVYEYTAGARRQDARSAASHNTLTFDGADQAEFFSRFRVGRRPTAELLAFSPDQTGVAFRGTHDGFANLDGAPRHVRSAQCDARGLRIEDRVEGDCQRGAAARFLLHPQVTPARVSECAFALQLHTGRAVLTSSVPLAIEPAVWWPDLGEEQATQRLVANYPRERRGQPLVTEIRLA